MPDFLKTIYGFFYNLLRPIPSDQEIAEIVKSLPNLRENDVIPRAAQQVCLISFGLGGHDICLPTIHDVTNCEMAAARINQKSGRTDAVGNMIDGCPANSKSIMPAP